MEPVSGRELYRIGDLLLDGDSKTLSRDGQAVPLAYRSAQLLLELARNHPKVVRRIDLIESVWPTEDVTDQALSQRVSLLRKELGDTAEKPKYIGRRWGWGYYLLATVERLSEEPARAEGRPAPVSPGSRLGPYEVLNALGSGGMGEVYRARDTRLGREVAVKVLPAEYSKDPDRLRRFEREAQAAAAPKHPSILVLHDIGTQEGMPYIVTELLEGETLREVLERGPLPVARAVELGVQIARGLSAAHEKGVVHRDLQPENLFVTKEGPVKILDFGLARLRDPESAPQGAEGKSPPPVTSTQEGKVLGTPGYMSPEQLRGQPADARSDIFALGCVLYEMVSGRRPFAGATPADEAAAILKEAPPDLHEEGNPVPAALELIIRRCLEKNPAERFQSARDLAFALETVSTTVEAGVIPAALVPRPARRIGRFSNPWVLASALCAAVAVAAVAAVALLLLRGAGGHPPQPTFRQLTFRRGYMGEARFMPDGKNVVYAAAWDGKPLALYSVEVDSPESRKLGFEGVGLMAVFPNSDLALRLPGGALARVPFNGGAPREILGGVFGADVGSDPNKILAVRGESNTYRIECPIGKVLYRSNRPIGSIRLSRGGDRVAFTHENPREVWMLDADGKARMLSTGWQHLNGLAWSPKDDEIWFTGGRTGLNMALYAVTPGGRERLVYRAPSQLVLVDLFPDGRALLCRQSSRECVAAWDAQAGEERDLSWYDYGFLGALSADGKRLLFTERGEPVAGKNVVYLRGTDGSPAVRLGEGYGLDLSHDGQWVLARTPGSGYGGDQLIALPTGPGELKALTHDGIDHENAQWMPDGKGFIFFGNEPGHDSRFFRQDAQGGAPKPLTPEGGYGTRMAISPDGRDLAYSDLEKEGLFLVSTDGGQPRVVPGDHDGDRPITFGAGGKTLLVRRGMSVYRVELATGVDTLVREIKPQDPAGFSMRILLMTPDEKTYAYGYYRELSDLFVAEGLR